MRVVLVRLSALGDIVHTWPLAVAVRAAQPTAHLTWIVEEPLRLLVEGHPALDAVITVHTRRWRRSLLGSDVRARISILKSRLGELQPDLALDPQGVFKSAVVTKLSRAPRRVGLAAPWRRERLAGLAYTETIEGSRAGRHVVATNLELVRAVGGVPPEELPDPDGRWLAARLADRPSPVPPTPAYLALLAGTARSHKLLPVEVLTAVARQAAAAGLQVQVVWGPGERELAAAVVDRSGGSAQLAPPTDLAELVRVLAGARAVVGGDTGPLHLAASFGVPALAIFTTTDWRRNGPLGARVEVVSGALGEIDEPTGSSRARRPGPVTVDEVAAGLARLLATPGG